MHTPFIRLNLELEAKGPIRGRALCRNSGSSGRSLDGSVREVCAELKDVQIVSIGEPEPVEFYLRYEGRVPSSAGDETIRAKHEIRQALHKQLAELWKSTPELKHLAEKESNGSRYIQKLASDFSVGDFKFVPLVTERLRLVCHLDILFLRREPAGALITKPRDVYGGDLDNRLKVFFDALRVPTDLQELPSNTAPESHEQPYFYCLVEDDSLITKFQVESGKLLERPSLKDSMTNKEIQKHVSLLVKATTRITAMTLENMAFLNG